MKGKTKYLLFYLHIFLLGHVEGNEHPSHFGVQSSHVGISPAFPTCSSQERKGSVISVLCFLSYNMCAGLSLVLASLCYAEMTVYHIQTQLGLFSLCSNIRACNCFG